MVKFIGQLAIAGAIVGAVFVLLPVEIYGIVAALAALVTFGLMLSVESEYLEITAYYAIHTLIIAMVFGVCWPALPPIVVWGGVKRRKAAASSKDNSSPSSPTSP